MRSATAQAACLSRTTQLLARPQATTQRQPVAGMRCPPNFFSWQWVMSALRSFASALSDAGSQKYFMHECSVRHIGLVHPRHTKVARSITT
eukprot:6198059-Pleurochrysis_carterae.AAC.3